MSIVATHPELVKQWHLDNLKRPDEVTAGSSYRAIWQDRHGHEWEARVADRALKGSSCPFCSNKRVLPGFNDLATTHPELASQYSTKNVLSAEEITAGSLRKVIWTGDCTHSWEATVVNRRNGTGCPYCSNQKVLIGFNDFATCHPDILMEWDDPRDPSEFSSVTRSRIRWKCLHGHKWTATGKDRTDRGGTGCPSCVDVRQSKIEGALFDVIADRYPEASRGYSVGLNWPSGQKIVVDIFVPERHAVVEWDGSKWHRSRELKDTQKSKILLDAGYTVIRLRERPLTMLGIYHDRYQEMAVSHRNTRQYLETILKSLSIDTESAGER